MTTTLVFLAVGLLGSIVIAWVGYRRQSLSRSGAVGTIIVGATVFAFGGSAWWILLIAFFVSSSGLSHFQSGRKTALKDEILQRRPARHLASAGQWGTWDAAINRSRY